MLDRLRRLAREAAKFGIVGGVGFIVDVAVFNLLRYAGDPGVLEHKPLTAKAISVCVATVVTYLGNRHWTWRHRARTGARREMTLFFILNGVGMGIALLCLAVSHYLLDFTSALADNISANVVGLFLGMLFRFWSYRTFVFRKHPEDEALDLVGHIADEVEHPSGEGARSVETSPSPAGRRPPAGTGDGATP
ncbi:MAG: GtrA family protein [Nocardioidaceae bacterium]